MSSGTFVSINPEEMRRYMSTKKEAEYLLVDVRQPAEYSQGHIPGARLIPLNELEGQLRSLPPDRDIFFYCRSGARSQAASVLATGNEHSFQKVFNLVGGITGWNGQTLTQIPQLQIFDGAQKPADLLLKSMDLEKGAWRFYRHVMKNYGDQAFAATIAGLEKVEFAHAKMIYGFWQPMTGSREKFENLFDSLEGEILEGGQDLGTAVEKIDNLGPEACLGILEMALSIELSAYDLYRTVANLVDGPEARDSFLSIAQAEKEHMRVLAKATGQC